MKYTQIRGSKYLWEQYDTIDRLTGHLQKTESAKGEGKETIPVLFQCGRAKIVRDIMDQLRRYFSRSFFDTIQTVSKNKKNSKRAIRFAALRVDGILVDAQRIEEYIRELY